MNWEANSGGAGTAGHVAWVERINSNNTVFLSEWNWNYGDGLYNERDGYSGDHYLHILDSGSCSNLTNKVVSSGQSLNCNSSNMTVRPESHFQNGSNVNLKSI
jgi:surface antigen